MSLLHGPAEENTPTTGHSVHFPHLSAFEAKTLASFMREKRFEANSVFLNVLGAALRGDEETFFTSETLGPALQEFLTYLEEGGYEIKEEGNADYVRVHISWKTSRVGSLETPSAKPARKTPPGEKTPAKFPLDEREEEKEDDNNGSCGSCSRSAFPELRESAEPSGRTEGGGEEEEFTRLQSGVQEVLRNEG